jgi:hypothetical protein
MCGSVEDNDGEKTFRKIKLKSDRVQEEGSND